MAFTDKTTLHLAIYISENIVIVNSAFVSYEELWRSTASTDNTLLDLHNSS